MIFKSPQPDIQIPDISLPELVMKNCKRLADKPAFIDGISGRKVTYAEMGVYIDRMAAALAARGLVKGDVLAIYSPNLPEYPIVFHGAALAGGVITTANPLSSAEDLALQLKMTRAKFLVTVAPLMEKATKAAKEAGIAEIFSFGQAEGATPLADLLKTKEKTPKVKINAKEDLVALPFSSGTTGLPKGVMLTHYNLVSNISQFLSIDTTIETDVIMSVLPFFHIYGMTCLVNATMVIGATVVTMPQFEVEGYLRLLQDYKVTQTYVAPPLVLMFTKHPLVANYDLSHLQVIFSGAAPLDAEMTEACAKRLNCVVTQGYGLTETAPGITSGFKYAERNRLGTVGQLLPNTLCRIVDVATKKDLDMEQEGEILVKGPQVMKGYFDNPEATKNMLDDQGWLHTGDIGKVDKDGYCSVIDRVKELIKYKGFQVAPAELEGLLLRHPAVADAAVIPRPDEEAGEVPYAIVVKKAPVTENELMEFVAERVTSYKRIRAVEFAESIPKSPSGKILRRFLVANLRQKLQERSASVTRLEDRVTVERRGHILLVGLDRPNKLNAFDPEMFRGLAKALTDVDDDPEIRCAVVFAHGPAFTAGLDLSTALPLFAQGQAFLPEGSVDPWGVTGRRERRKPLVIALHGRCWTLGIELCLAADIVIASADTRFCQMEVSRGIMPFGGATIRLPQAAGWGNAMRYLLTGDEFGADEAHRLGIVQEVVPVDQALPRAVAIAERIAAQSPLGVQATLASARQALRSGFDETAKSLFPTVQGLMATNDCKEGVRSFLEKRAATFSGT
jgi:acyl-CoA synthetase (AMP-forming)/AMP-acid ligase II/enoyl-CoA hydratase/carnithine racemase